MKYLLGILIVLMISNIYAICENGQIDINSASLAKLDELTGIGPVKAQAIIDTRIFDSVDDLINVYGIGEVTLQKIKEQGLACVEEEEQEDEEIPEKTSQEEHLISTNIQNKKKEEAKLEIITLNSPTKDIKSDDDKKILDKSSLAKYGFIVFCILLGFLFILKKPKIQEID